LIPLAASYAWAIPGHGLATSALLSPLFLACIRYDLQLRAAGILALALGGHCIFAIALTTWDPDRAASILPGAEHYWQQTVHWIRTGEDPEYELANWVPAHILLLVGLALFSYTSLGFVPFLRGIHQADLMNYYVGRLLTVSESGTTAVLVGWHVWSIMRGLAYTILIYEIASLSLERLGGRTLSSPRRRFIRLAVGLGLCAGDGIFKFFLLGPVREVLFDNLATAAR
jgi:hypothetical protein